MNLQLLANSNVKLPSNLSHIKIDYGYSYYWDELVNLTINNSFTARQLFILDNLLNHINPTNETDKKIIAEIAEKSYFLDQALEEDFTKNLKIQINVNSGLNSQFKKLATTLFNPRHPLALSVTSNISFMYPDTQQVVIGTKEFNLNKKEFEKGVVIFNYAYMKQSSLQEAVAFTLLHEISHTLENYCNKNYGPLDDKIHNVYSVLKYFDNNIENNKDEKNTKKITPQDYNIKDTLIQNLHVLYGEIYADCGAILLQRNYDIQNNKYNIEVLDKSFTSLINSREVEKEIISKLPENNMIISDHWTVYGLKFLNEEILTYPEKILSQKEIHSLSQQAVTYGIEEVLKNLIANQPEYKKSIELLFNMKLNNDELQIAKKIIPIEDSLYNLQTNNQVKLKA